MERQVLKQSGHLSLSLSHMEKVDFEIKREWKNKERTNSPEPSFQNSVGRCREELLGTAVLDSPPPSPSHVPLLPLPSPITREPRQRKAPSRLARGLQPRLEHGACAWLKSTAWHHNSEKFSV